SLDSSRRSPRIVSTSPDTSIEMLSFESPGRSARTTRSSPRRSTSTWGIASPRSREEVERSVPKPKLSKKRDISSESLRIVPKGESLPEDERPGPFESSRLSLLLRDALRSLPLIGMSLFFPERLLFPWKFVGVFFSRDGIVYSWVGGGRTRSPQSGCHMQCC